MVEKSKIAFSIGGLGGSNAHSAGFLAAAAELKVEPDLIACTSGPLLWVYDYIRGIDLRELFEKLPRYSHPIYKFFDPRLRRQVREFMYPAVAEYWARWLWPFPFRHRNDDFVKNATDWWLDRLLPAHVLNESHGDEWFDDIAFTFNSAKTPSGKPLGIVFNVFKPGTGTEYLYANDAGHDSLVSRSNTEGDESHVHKTQIMSPINGEAVRDALRFWLYGFERPILPWSYGFGVRSFDRIDGGYHRQIILRELHGYDRIYTVRPQAQGWMGELPRNTLELMDLIVELWFNSSYAGDVAGLELINDLLERGQLPPTTDYKHVEIIPVEVQKNYGFTDYFGESPELFEAAYMQSSVTFAKDIGSHLVETAEVVSTPLVTTLPHAA